VARARCREAADMSESRHDETLADLLERDPGRFEATTAFRVAQDAGDLIDTETPAGSTPAILPVASFRRDGSRSVVKSALASLAGPLGSLPPAYDEFLMREKRNKSRALSTFLDMFSARMAELFVDASEKYRLARLLRWNSDGRRNGFLTALMSLAGLGTAKLVERSNVEEDVVLRFAGFFAARTRNASNLQAMLAEFTGLPVRVELFRGRWLSIPESEQSRMGAESAVRLGVNSMAGAKVRDFSGGFRIVIGPVGYADYLALSPGERGVKEIFALTRLFVGPGLEFDLQIVLRKEEIPFSRLGGGTEPARLGWNSWARSAAAGRDSGDAVIREAA